MKYVASTVAAIGLSLAVAAPVHAQNVNANNLVNVNISNVANEIAENLSISDVADIPASVQVPVGIAANVCPSLDANVIGQSKGDADNISCDAENVTQGLSQAVQRQMNQG